MQIIEKNDPNAIELACKFLHDGKVISFATDTIYGLAVDASNPKAVENLYRLKKRDEKKPIAIFIKNIAEAKKLFLFEDLAEKIAQKFLPGSLTLILKSKADASQNLAENLNQNKDGFLGFRIVDDVFINNLLEKFGGILAVTSANFSNEKSAINAEEVKEYFKNSTLSLLVDGGVCKERIASTIAKISNNKLTILRQGPINLSAYEHI